MLAILAALAAAPFTAADLVSLNRVSDPQVSPDGRYVAYVLRETDLEANKGRTDLWLLEPGAANATPRRLTQHPASDTSPRWAPTAVRSISFRRARAAARSGVLRSRAAIPLRSRRWRKMWARSRSRLRASGSCSA